MEPVVIDASAPSLVVWSSLWPDRPRDRIRFTIDSDGASGSRLKWSLETDEEAPDADRVKDMRHRINQLINGECATPGTTSSCSVWTWTPLMDSDPDGTLNR
jgi:hypothetical protein